MIKAKEYLPVGSVVLLKGAVKKAVIIGIMQSMLDVEKNVTEYDYIGVMYPEGLLTTETMFMFNHDSITDVVFRGYENQEREELIEKLEKNIEKVKAYDKT